MGNKMKNHSFKGDGSINYNDISACIDGMKGNCRICNLEFKRKKGTICPNCCFSFTSNYGNPGGRTRVRPAASFKKYGLVNLPAIGKHAFFYFLDHPELNFTYPEIPRRDFFHNWNMSKEEAIVSKLNPLKAKRLIWNIHHEKAFFNDLKEYTILCLNTEHSGYFEQVKKGNIIP